MSWVYELEAPGLDTELVESVGPKVAATNFSNRHKLRKGTKITARKVSGELETAPRRYVVGPHPRVLHPLGLRRS